MVRPEETLPHLPAAPSLNAFMNKALLEKIRDHFSAHFSNVLEHKAEHFVYGLKVNFNRLAKEYEQRQENPELDDEGNIVPQPPLEQQQEELLAAYFEQALIRDATHEEYMTTVERMDHKLDGPALEHYKRADQLRKTRLQIMRPVIRQALEKEIKTMQESSGDNWLTDNMTSAVEFIDNSLYDLSRYDINDCKLAINIILFIAEHDKDPVNMELFKLASKAFITGFTSLMVCEPSLRISEIKDRLIASRARIDFLFADEAWKNRERIGKIHKTLPKPEGHLHLVAEFQDSVLKQYDHLIALMDKISDEKTLVPSPAQAPWRYNID
jgi:hypothetical protein